MRGEKADPVKVLGRLQRKSHRRVELISPIPVPSAPEPEPIEKPKTEEKKPEVLLLRFYFSISVLTFWIPFHLLFLNSQRQIVTVVLKVHMHCEACAQEIKRRIHRMKGLIFFVASFTFFVFNTTLKSNKLVDLIWILDEDGSSVICQ